MSGLIVAMLSKALDFDSVSLMGAMRLKSVIRAAAKDTVFRKKDLSSSRIDLSIGGRKSRESSAEFKLILPQTLEQTEKVRQRRRDISQNLRHPRHSVLMILNQ